MDNWTQKIGILAGAVAAIAGSTNLTPLVPAKYQPVVTAIGTIAGTLAALYHPAPAPRAS